MSYHEPKPRRKSSCCIVLLIIGLIVGGLFVAMGIFSYRLVKDNFQMLDVAAKTDPDANALPESVLPEAAGEFRRVAISDNVTTNIPNVKDLRTTGVIYGLYKDQVDNEVTVIAVPTRHGETPDLGGFEKLVQRRDQQKSNHAISIKDTFSGPEPNTTVLWAKPNWTFIVQTTSTLGQQFVKDFHPAGTPAP